MVGPYHSSLALFPRFGYEWERTLYSISESIPKSMPADSSKTVPATRSALTTPSLRDWPVTHPRGMGLSSGVPCQHRTLNQGSTIEQNA